VKGLLSSQDTSLSFVIYLRYPQTHIERYAHCAAQFKYIVNSRAKNASC